MKATSHWLEMKGHTEKSPSMVFDEIFTDEIVKHGKIEDSKVLIKFLQKTGQPLMQDWLIQIVMNIAKKLPIAWGIKSAWSFVFHPRTRRWGKAKKAIEDYIIEVEQKNKTAVAAAAGKPIAANANAPRPKLHAAE